MDQYVCLIWTVYLHTLRPPHCTPPVLFVGVVAMGLLEIVHSNFDHNFVGVSCDPDPERLLLDRCVRGDFHWTPDVVSI